MNKIDSLDKIRSERRSKQEFRQLRESGEIVQSKLRNSEPYCIYL